MANMHWVVDMLMALASHFEELDLEGDFAVLEILINAAQLILESLSRILDDKTKRVRIRRAHEKS